MKKEKRFASGEEMTSDGKRKKRPRACVGGVMCRGNGMHADVMM